MGQKTAIIIGAGPAGLTAAYELIEKTDIRPIIYEASDGVGGLARTIDYKGNLMDIGGHRYFSKSARVREWWQKFLPVQKTPAKNGYGKNVKNSHFSAEADAPDPEKTNRVMLIRKRVSSIFFSKKFFSYPLDLDLRALSDIGVVRSGRIIFSYLKTRFSPAKREENLEDFFINRFGRELYGIFFKDYTQKLWGIPCSEIKVDWGVQRINDLSIGRALAHAFKRIPLLDNFFFSQDNTEATLIGNFLYPKLGSGQLWNEVARAVKENGGEIHLKHGVTRIKYEDDRVTGLEVKNELTGEVLSVKGDYFFSTMPVKSMIQFFDGYIPERVRQVARGLMYRDIIVIGLLLKGLKIRKRSKKNGAGGAIPDNWIYIQEKDVCLGRIQILNNWSPYLVKEKDKIWLGLEYFCGREDWLWNKPDDDLIKFAVEELRKIGFIDEKGVLDSVVVKTQWAYPTYSGTYEHFPVVREFLDRFDNLFLIGRNGMHRYNNIDHSMLTAMTAVENIVRGIGSKDNIWDINTKREYHESTAGKNFQK